MDKILGRCAKSPNLLAIKNMVRDTLPKTLQGTKYKNLRCTIDCTEVFIERPRHLATQAVTWSDYKHHNTVKFLVGIAPNGHISFLSAAWGGRASNQMITRESGFYTLLKRDDLILADRGFPIREDLMTLLPFGNSSFKFRTTSNE